MLRFQLEWSHVLAVQVYSIRHLLKKNVIRYLWDGMRGSSFNFATIMVVLSTETKCWYPLLLLKLYLLIHYFTVWALIGWTSEASSNAFHICLARALLIQLFPTAFTIWYSLKYVNYFCLPLKILKVSNHCYLQFYTLHYDKWNCIFIKPMSKFVLQKKNSINHQNKNNQKIM